MLKTFLFAAIATAGLMILSCAVVRAGMGILGTNPAPETRTMLTFITFGVIMFFSAIYVANTNEG